MELYSLLLIVGGVLFATVTTSIIRRDKKKQSNELIRPIGDENDYNSKKSFDKRPVNAAFSENLDKFSPLLPGIEKGEIDIEKWKEAIINTNNEQLILYWKNVIGNPDVAEKWLKIVLEPSGIHYDDCLSFVSTSLYAERYSLNNGTPLIKGETYNVISPCWLYSSFDENDVETITVLQKGIVEIKH